MQTTCVLCEYFDDPQSSNLPNSLDPFSRMLLHFGNPKEWMQLTGELYTIVAVELDRIL